MPFTTRPELRGSFGAVSSSHWLATHTAMSVLSRGGNAFDAAVAAGFVLQVVEPHMNGLGGDLPIILWDVTRSKVEVICGQGPAPAGVSIDAIRSLRLDGIPGTGLLAACVPGAFGAWMALLRDHGTWSVEGVLEPAIGYAHAGFPLLPRTVQTLANVEALFRERWPSSAAVYLRDGVPKPWSRATNHDLARTYTRLVEAARSAPGGREAGIEAALRGFYSGFVAEAVDRHSRAAFVDASGEEHSGFLTAADLAAFEAAHEAPVTAGFGPWTVCKCGPWTQGPVFLQQLRLLAGAGLDRTEFLSADHVHAVVEAAKLAFADREAWYGDPGFNPIPLEVLLSDAYTDERRRLIGARASFEMRPGRPDGREARLPWRTSMDVAAGHESVPSVGGEGRSETRGDTCHVAVADRHGNLAACTPSGGWLQSSPVIDGLGFCLGTRAQMFNLEAGHPNRVEGGKRPRTTLSPTMALVAGAPRLAFGTPGGDQQDQWTLNFFLAHAVFGLDLQAAIDAPEFHTTHFPSSFAPHESFPGRVHVELEDQAVLADLERRGHAVERLDRWSLGRVCAVGRDPETGWLRAAADPRAGQAYAGAR